MRKRFVRPGFAYRGLGCLGALTLMTLGAGQLQAGNVKASLSGGNLYVYGDSGANSVSITSSEPGKIIIADAGGGEITTINGSEEPLELNGWTRGIYVYLYEGDDFVELSSLNVNGAVHVDLGGGNDELLVFGGEGEEAAGVSISGSLLILGGSGDETITLDGLSVNGVATVNLAGGADEVFIGTGVLDEESSSAHFHSSLVIVPGAGEDIVDLMGVKVDGDLTIDDPTDAADVYVELVDVGRNLFVFTSISDDIVTIVDVYVNDLLKVIAKDGIDDVSLDTVNADRVELFLGARDDLLTATGIIANRMWAYLEGGNDLASLTDSSVERLVIYGAAGNDEMTITTVDGVEATIYGEGGNDTLIESGNDYDNFRVYTVENR